MRGPSALSLTFEAPRWDILYSDWVFWKAPFTLHPLRNSGCRGEGLRHVRPHKLEWIPPGYSCHGLQNGSSTKLWERPARRGGASLVPLCRCGPSWEPQPPQDEVLPEGGKDWSAPHILEGTQWMGSCWGHRAGPRSQALPVQCFLQTKPLCSVQWDQTASFRVVAAHTQGSHWAAGS